MLPVKKTEKTKNILRNPERCRNLIPVSKPWKQKKMLNAQINDFAILSRKRFIDAEKRQV
jgi:hypothetical protein